MSFEPSSLLFLVLAPGGGVSTFFGDNSVKVDPVSVLGKLFFPSNGDTVEVALPVLFVSPKVFDEVIPALARLSLCKAQLAFGVGSFFSAFDFLETVTWEDCSVFSGLFARFSCLLRQEDVEVGFKSKTEKWGLNGKEVDEVEDEYREVDLRRDGEG